jgi:hypothetical protein
MIKYHLAQVTAVKTIVYWLFLYVVSKSARLCCWCCTWGEECYVNSVVSS